MSLQAVENVCGCGKRLRPNFPQLPSADCPKGAGCWVGGGGGVWDVGVVGVGGEGGGGVWWKVVW